MGKFYVGSKRRSIFARCCAGSLLEMLDIVSPFIKENVLLISAKKTIANLVWTGFEVTLVVVDRQEPWQLVHHVYSTTTAHVVDRDRSMFLRSFSWPAFRCFLFFLSLFSFCKVDDQNFGENFDDFFFCFLEIL